MPMYYEQYLRAIGSGVKESGWNWVHVCNSIVINPMPNFKSNAKEIFFCKILLNLNVLHVCTSYETDYVTGQRLQIAAG
jgi:hypothetical protein